MAIEAGFAQARHQTEGNVPLRCDVIECGGTREKVSYREGLLEVCIRQLNEEGFA